MPIYLDHNASTPMDEKVLDTLMRVSRDVYSNASSVEHSYGNAAAREVDNARSVIASVIGCRPQEIIFTSGATEANNLAIFGTFDALREAGRDHLITSQIEHPSVLACFDALERQGAKVTRLSVDENGVVNLGMLSELIGENTGLVSIMSANNETGVLQPIDEIGAICEEAGAIFHTDYSQATAYIPIDLKTAPVHLASFSAHKAYGPKGVGVLYRSLRKPRVKLDAVLQGGGQENGLRSGTYNTAAIAAMGTAFEILPSRISADAANLSTIRDELVEQFSGQIDGVQFTGLGAPRLPNTLSLSIKDVEPLALMHKLKNDIIFSASSACSTGKVETSPVLLAMYGNSRHARESFRIGLGRGSSFRPSDLVGLFSRSANALRLQRL